MCSTIITEPALSCGSESRKTRIETGNTGRSPDRLSRSLVEVNPEKQGLKLIDALLTLLRKNRCLVEVNPEKQGLKQMWQWMARLSRVSCGSESRKTRIETGANSRVSLALRRVSCGSESRKTRIETTGQSGPSAPARGSCLVEVNPEKQGLKSRLKREEVERKGKGITNKHNIIRRVIGHTHRPLYYPKSVSEFPR